MACGLTLLVRDWLWHLTLNTGELKKCERLQFTDWDWAQIEEANPLPGSVEMPSKSNYWLYTTADRDKKWGTFEFRRPRVGVGPKRTLFFRFVPFPRLTKRKKLYAKRQRTAELGRVFPDMTARNVRCRIFRKTMPPPDNPDQIVGRHY